MATEYLVKGNVFRGIVIRQKSPKTAVVEREIVSYVPKYERYAKKKSKLAVHVPDDIKVSVGDDVKIGETRKISKTKNFIIMEVMKKAK